MVGELLAEHYAATESAWDVSPPRPELGRLVVAADNDGEPFHGWFRFKEAYSRHLFGHLTNGSTPASVLDPFAGSGTTLLSALQSAGPDQAIEVAGIERSPLMHQVSRAKLAGFVHGRLLSARLRTELPKFTRRLSYARRTPRPTASVTLNNSKYFDSETVVELLALGRAANGCSDPEIRDVLCSAVASIVEGCGHIRKDGRTVRHDAKASVKVPIEAFDSAIAKILKDLDAEGPKSRMRADCRLGDARASMSASAPVAGYDLICFSPPYPNNIDYTEVYKVESWVLELWGTAEDMRGQRLETLRSHPSVRFKRPFSYLEDGRAAEVAKVLAPVVSSIPTDRYHAGRMEVVCGYFDDMLQVLDRSREVVARDGRLVYVVGNSRHGVGDNAFTIASDILIAAIAELSGWRVEKLEVARTLIRRGQSIPYLRESIVTLRPDPEWHRKG